MKCFPQTKKNYYFYYFFKKWGTAIGSLSGQEIKGGRTTLLSGDHLQRKEPATPKHFHIPSAHHKDWASRLCSREGYCEAASHSDSKVIIHPWGSRLQLHISISLQTSSLVSHPTDGGLERGWGSCWSFLIQVAMMTQAQIALNQGGFQIGTWSPL